MRKHMPLQGSEHLVRKSADLRKAEQALAAKAALDFRALNDVNLSVSMCYMARFT